MIRRTWLILPILFLMVACNGNGGGADAGDAGDDGGDFYDGGESGDPGDAGADDGGDPGTDRAEDGGNGDGDRERLYECPFPFAPPQKYTFIDEFGQEVEAWERQVLCAVDYQDTRAQVLLIAKPIGMQFMDILYEAKDAYVCQDKQVQQLTQGTFSYEAKHHGWDEMNVVFDGLRYFFRWSEVCVGWRPCTATFDIFDVYDANDGSLIASNQPTTCVRLLDSGNPRPLVPQVRVPADGDDLTFFMGSNTGEQDELPVHDVYLRPVRMDVREATWTDFALFLSDHGNDCDGNACINTSGEGAHLEMQGDLFRPEPGFEDHPAVQVTWHGAKAYCQWRSWLQLPTEAHWELAASAAGTLDYPWGDNMPSCDLALYGDCGESAPDPVCSRTAGNSRESVCDLAGNLAEWVSDWYQADFYSICATNCSNPTGPETGTEKVIRGGSFQSGAYYIRSADRSSQDPSTPSSHVGVRCVRWTFPQNQ